MSPTFTLNLETLPREILLQILTYLPIPDLSTLLHTTHTLRHLARDPILHLHRLHLVPCVLDPLLAHRPSLHALRPPRAWIHLSRTHVLARSISRSLIAVRLTHSLLHRPPAHALINRAILPAEYTSVAPALIQSRQAVAKERLRHGLGKRLQRRPSVGSLVSLNILPEECVGRVVSPGLVATRRRVMRERLKDGLRAWVEGRAVLAQERRVEEGGGRESVKGLVRRFTFTASARRGGDDGRRGVEVEMQKKRKAQARWGREAEVLRKREREERRRGSGACEQPTRAHVLGLKRFWEGVIRTAAA